MAGKQTKNPIYTAVKVVFGLLFIATIVFLLFVIVACTKVDNADKSIFGYRIYHVQSGSMSKRDGSDEKIFFNAGDLIFVKEADPTSLQEGDVITFVSLSVESYGKVVTHKIRRVERATNGKLLGYITYGIYTGEDDGKMVQPQNIIGVYAGKLPKMGTAIAFLQTKQGLALAILFPSLLVLVLYSVRFGKYYASKEYKEDKDGLRGKANCLGKEKVSNQPDYVRVIVYDVYGQPQEIYLPVKKD